MGEETLIKTLASLDACFLMKNLDTMSCYVFFSFKSLSKLCSMTSQREIDGIIRRKLGKFLGMFDFSRKVHEDQGLV